MDDAGFVLTAEGKYPGRAAKASPAHFQQRGGAAAADLGVLQLADADGEGTPGIVKEPHNVHIRQFAGLNAKAVTVSGLSSGGYMAACACTQIISLPMGIVGSIGVISMRPMLYEMLEKLGVRMEVTKAGRLKDMFSNFREPTDEEREKEQALLDSIYGRFVGMVADARKLPVERVRELATGEIYTAEQAKEHGLIDGLGDLDAAIDLAQSLAGLSERKVTYLRPHKTLRERLLSGTSTGVMVSVSRRLLGRSLMRSTRGREARSSSKQSSLRCSIDSWTTEMSGTSGTGSTSSTADGHERGSERVSCRSRWRTA